jgi:cytochrome b561
MTARPLASAGVAYDPVARAIHWLVAILLVFVVTLGWTMVAAPLGTPARGLLFRLHRSIGLVILGAMLVRALWRRHRPPPPLPPLPRLEAILAQATHLALYALVIAMPITGYVNAAASGHGVSLFGLVRIPPVIPEDDRLAQVAVALHLAGQYLVCLFVLLHVAGALSHAVLRRDGLVDRMLPRRRPP